MLHTLTPDNFNLEGTYHNSSLNDNVVRHGMLFWYQIIDVKYHEWTWSFITFMNVNFTMEVTFANSGTN